MEYETLDLAFNFALTAILNLLPALIIRYAIKKKRFGEKKHAVITCAIIAIVAWSIVWLISFSSVGSGVVPKGAPEIIFAVINFAILKPKAPTEGNVATPDSSDGSKANKKDDSTQTMDASMREYADIMMPEKGTSKRISTNKLTRLNIVLIISTLVFALSTSTLAIITYNMDKEVKSAKASARECKSNYDKAKKAHASQIQEYEDEINDIYELYFSDRGEFDFWATWRKEALESSREGQKKVDAWNKAQEGTNYTVNGSMGIGNDNN